MAICKGAPYVSPSWQERQTYMTYPGFEVKPHRLVFGCADHYAKQAFQCKCEITQTQINAKNVFI